MGTEVEPVETENTRDKHEGRDPKTGNWLKGYCPNPNGRRGKDGESGASLTAALHRYLESNPSEIDALAAATVENAKQGNAVALKQTWDRLDGTVTDRSETLIRQAGESEMSREAILIAADRIRALEAENQGSTLTVETPLSENRSFDTPKE